MMTWLKRILVTVAILIVLFLAVRYHRQILDFLGDEAQIQAWLDQLGPLGPLGAIALNALQVVVAFIPGYVTQVASGFFFGYPKGAVYGVIGMLLGGVIAVGLARLLGRPLVVRMVGEDRLNRWEHVARLDSLPIWFVLMLAPFGDVPYYIAGLTSLPIWKIIAVAALVRTPSVLIATAVGAGVIDYRNPFFIAGVVIVVIVAVVALRYQTRIERFVDEVLLPRALKLTARRRPSDVVPATPVLAAESQDYDAASN
jgi:uncharacterized membrane protein YdjX (TVP38/TMEM64 family)